MPITTFSGTVEDGQVKLAANVHLPEKAKVYVVVPGMQVQQIAYIISPRLVHPEQAVDFKLEVVEEPADASV